MAIMNDEITNLLYVQWLVDSNGNKKITQVTNEQYKVLKGRVLLNMIPTEFNHVTISGMSEMPKGQKITSATQFYVNYINGEVVFHSSKEGTTVTIAEYWGQGQIYIDKSRIVTENDGSDVIKTLDANMLEWQQEFNENVVTFTANELARYKTFNASETSRTSTFGNSETGRTNTFKASEVARTSTFGASEASRTTTFKASEDIRTVNEEVRKATEIVRKASEVVRESNEGKRIATFNTNEADRADTFDESEAYRETNEDVRQGNEEIRINTFEANEEERINTFDANETDRMLIYNNNEADRSDIFGLNEADRKDVFDENEAQREEDFDKIQSEWDDSVDQMVFDGGEVIINLKNKEDMIYIGDTAPTDLTALWINNKDEEVNEVVKADLELDIRKSFQTYNEVLEKLDYALTYELDPGYFKGILPGTDPSVVAEEVEGTPDLGTGAEGTVGHILVKRGLKEDIEELQQGEFGFCIDTEELYIGNNGRFRLIAKVGGTSDGGSSNVTGEYVELISNNGSKFRLTVNDDGEPIFFNSEVDTITSPLPADSGRFIGLLINKVYGGGARSINNTPVSHGFIELYNSTENTINLKGMSLQYGEYLVEWKLLALRGEIKPYSSFLVRCAEHTDVYRQTTKFKITDYDMNWDIAISDNGYKVYLSVSDEISEYVNPANTDGAWTKEVGYINMFAVGGEDVTRIIDGFETGFLHIGNKYRIMKRKYSTSLLYAFSNKGSNSVDIEYLDAREADINMYMPRSSRYGQWNYYYDKKELDYLAPNMVNIGFGEVADTTRTFTWQTPVTKKGYLRYKKKGVSEWTTLPTTKKFVAHIDTDVTIHSLIVKDLTAGTYVYMAGEEGRWSDEHEFIILDATPINRPIRMLQVSDQQGWDETEYSAWGKASEYIQRTEDYDFILNTGDMSQNANRSFEWRYYFDFARENINSHVHMMCCGNNDLIDKKDSLAFTYYSTAENSPYHSVHSFNYGYIHYICLNSNIIEGFMGLPEQLEFLRADMAKPENQKRWTIVYMHESPYTIVKSAKLVGFIDVFAELGVDLVLCGHHHCYSRSKRMGARVDGVDTVDTRHGVYYVMSQATGAKLSGKQIPVVNAPWAEFYEKPGDPSYIMWEITYNKIKMFPVRITNIMPLIDNIGKDAVGIPFDEGFEIVK